MAELPPGSVSDRGDARGVLRAGGRGRRPGDRVPGRCVAQPLAGRHGLVSQLGSPTGLPSEILMDQRY